MKDINTASVENTEATQAEAKGEQRTFTQDDLNRIIQDRLAKDRQKSSDELSRREQELAQREFRLNSRQKLLDRGYEENILDVLNCNDEKALDKALDMIDGLIEKRVMESTKPRAFRPEELKMIEAYRKENGQDPKGTDLKFTALSKGFNFMGEFDSIRSAMSLD